MATNICSIWAYHEIIESGYIGKNQARFLSVFCERNEPLSHKEATAFVEERFGVKLPERSGRITELKDKGFLRVYDFVRCPKTKKRVNRWIWTGRTKPLAEFLENVTCECCKGKGVVQKKVYRESSPKELFNIPKHSCGNHYE